jgi:predicted MFS family arabinose efflux permease
MHHSSRYTSHQIVVLLVCVGIFALGQFHRASGGVFTPILMDRFAVSAATIGGLVSAMFFATILAQVPFGVALDRKGPRIVLSLCVLVIAAGTAVFAFADSFNGMLLSRVLIGIGLAAMGAATHVIIARNFDGSDFGYISGLVVTLGGIGGLLGTYPLAFALERAAWPLVFAGVAGVTLLLAGLVFKVVRPANADRPEADPDATQDGFRTLLSQPEFLRILVLGAVTFAPITAITGLWGGPYLQDVVGLSAEQSGGVLLLLFLATIGAGFVFGTLDRIAKSRKRVILIAVAFSALMLLILAGANEPDQRAAVALLLVMVFLQQFYIPLGAHMKRTVPDHMLGRASTLLSLVSVAAIPAMQLGFGAVLDIAQGMGFELATQYRIAFGLMGCIILICGSVYAFSRNVDDPR